MFSEIQIHGPWTVQEFARLYKVSPATVYVWMKKGWLGTIKVGKTRRVTPEHEARFRARFNST